MRGGGTADRERAGARARCPAAGGGGGRTAPPAGTRRPTPLLLLALAACVTTTSVTYLPSAEQPRLTVEEGGRTFARFVGVECERLVAAGRGGGAAGARVALDSAGAVTSAEVLGTTGDARLDGLVGAVAAQLRLTDAAAARAARVRATYRCAGDAGATLVRLPDPAP